MGDKFEKFVLDHRGDFDDLEPSSDTWRAIESDLQKPGRDWTILWKVAAVLFLTSTIYLVFERNFDAESDQEIALIQNEFYQAERYYFELISQKRGELDDLNIEQRNYDLIEEEKQLDRMYQQLKKRYNATNQNEAVQDALLLNLRMRIQILSEQIEILSQNNPQQDEDIEI